MTMQTQASRLRATDARFLYRRNLGRLIAVVLGLFTLAVVAVLAVVIGYVIYKGAAYINWDFITNDPVRIGREGGGIRNSIVGSLIIVGLATSIAVPIGIATAIFVSEFPDTMLAGPLRTVANIMTSVPSVVVGLFAYAVLVAPFGGFSGYAGAGALAFIMVPIIMISAQEALRLVPESLREGTLALGIPRWRMILSVVVPAAYRALVTGLVLAIARALGETAPLIFTAFGNTFFTANPSEPMATIPLTIWRYAIAPYDELHQQAWAAAFILVVIVLLSSILTRLILRPKYDR